MKAGVARRVTKSWWRRGVLVAVGLVILAIGLDAIAAAAGLLVVRPQGFGDLLTVNLRGLPYALAWCLVLRVLVAGVGRLARRQSSLPPRLGA